MKTLLVDTSYLIYRSYFAYPNFLTEGKHTGAIYGFARTVISLARDYKVERIIFALDLPGKTWRHEMYTEYKAGRTEMDQQMREQIPVVIEFARLISPYVLSEVGYEADDMICSSVNAYQSDEFLILSSDRDLYQLLTNKNISFLKGKIGGYTLYSSHNFVEEFQVDPVQYVDYKALVGDGSDNIKGVPGIGPKTAAKLLQNIGSLKYLYSLMNWECPDYFRDGLVSDNLEAYVADPKNQDLIAKLLTHKDSLELAYNLSALHCRTVTLGNEGYNFTKAVELYERYNFQSILKELQRDKKSAFQQAQEDVALF